MAARVVCISVIDESFNSASNTTFNNNWDNFRSTYPNRVFYLLDPGGGGFGHIPPDYAADPEAFGPITVNRDNGNVANRSDWFDICGLNDAEDGTVVSLAVDTSGSMRLSTVQASYNYFISQCAAAGFVLVIDTTFPNERWITPHNKAVPPNTSISVSPTTILRNGSGATLTWTSAGDITDISVTGQTNPDLSGSVTVNPQNSTTYEINASGPEGSSSDSVVLTVVGPPVISSFTASPNPQTSGTDGIPNYNTTLSWSASTDLAITSATISSGTYSASATASASGTFRVTNLPQSVAGGGGASRTYTLTLCHSLACATETVTVEVTNDNTPSNTWTTEFTGLDPNTEYVRNLGTLAGIDMVTKVQTTTSGVFFANGANSAYSNPQYFSNGDNVYIKMITLPFNSDVSGLPPDQTFGKPNPKTVSVTVGSPLSAFDVTFTTRPPNIGETFNFDGAAGEYPFEDIDLINNTPSEFAVTQTLNMDDIDVDVEVRTDDPDIQIKINNQPWTYIQEI